MRVSRQASLQRRTGSTGGAEQFGQVLQARGAGHAAGGLAVTGYRRRRRGWVLALAVVVVAAGLGGADAAGVFDSCKPDASSNGYATSTRAVTRGPLTEQTQEDATLGDDGLLHGRGTDVAGFGRFGGVGGFGDQHVHLASVGRADDPPGPGDLPGLRHPGGAAVRQCARLPRPVRRHDRRGCHRAEHRPGQARLRHRDRAGPAVGLGLLQQRDRVRAGIAAGPPGTDPDRDPAAGAGGVPAGCDPGEQSGHRGRTRRRRHIRGHGAHCQFADPGGHDRPGRLAADRGRRSATRCPSPCPTGQSRPE